MDIDALVQQAHLLREIYEKYLVLLEEKEARQREGIEDQKQEQQLEKMRAYLVQIASAIQKGIDEEREYVYG